MPVKIPVLPHIFTHRQRPQLCVRDDRVTVKCQRGATWQSPGGGGSVYEAGEAARDLHWASGGAVKSHGELCADCHTGLRHSGISPWLWLKPLLAARRVTLIKVLKTSCLI